MYSAGSITKSVHDATTDPFPDGFPADIELHGALQGQSQTDFQFHAPASASDPATADATEREATADRSASQAPAQANNSNTESAPEQETALDSYSRMLNQMHDRPLYEAGYVKLAQEKGFAALWMVVLGQLYMQTQQWLLWLTIPVALVYLFYLIPLFVVLLIFCGLLMNFASWRRAPENCDPETKHDNHWLMKHVGSDNQGLLEYVSTSTAWPWLISFMVPLACRLFSGQGYEASFSNTLTDRSLAEYWPVLQSNLEHQINFVC